MRVLSHARTGAGTALAIALVSSPFGAVGASAQVSTPAPAAERVRPAQLTIFTTYPSIVADPGQDATFPLTVDGPTPERIDVAASELPEGFEASFRGGGSIVESVYTGGDEPPDLELRISVPEGAPAGDHRVVVTATGESGTAELPLDVVVGDVSGGSVTLTSDFPALRGASDDTFSFDLDLANDTSQDLDFTLEGVGPPDWQVTVQPSSEEQAATTQVDAGDSASLRATVTPAFRAGAGVYPVLVRASSGDEQAETELTIEITGTYDMDLTTPDGRQNTSVTAGSSTAFDLIIANLGSAPLTSIALDASTPQGWEVTFAPEEVPSIAAGETASVVATITPVGNAVAGDYVITMTARGDDADDEISVRTTVETSTLWGVVGIALIGLVLIGLALVFRRYGRR